MPRGWLKLSCAALVLFIPIALLGSSGIPELKKLEYSEPELKQLRAEVHANLEKLRQGSDVSIRWRTYKLKKDDNFFKVMARTMQNHDTLSSVNRLASLYDVDPGALWLIPNVRGIAVYGELSEIAAKYKLPASAITAVPGRASLWFVPGGKFEAQERKFFELKAFIRPVAGVISSGFGLRKDPFSDKKKFHKGIDIACPIGTPVKAAAGGKVIFVGSKDGYGKTVVLEHRNGYRTLYAHLSNFKVKEGDVVSQGEAIALSGNTGRSSGPHLHFEVRRQGQVERPRVH